MSDVQMFFKKNKIARPNVKYAATTTLVGKDGNPLEWEIRPLSPSDDEQIREACTIRVQVTGKPHLTKTELDNNKYIAKLVAASVVSPDLNSTDLQNSYGVLTPEDLLKAMVDNLGEYLAFVMFVQKLNGMDVSFGEDVETAKN